MEHSEERALVERARSGDREAFGRLYDAYIKKIYEFIYYKTHHRETAQDLTSDTFMKAFASIGRFDGDKGTMQSWLYRIARNTVIDYYRTKKEVQDVDDAWDVSSDIDVARDAEARIKIDAVQTHMKNLKPEQRDIIIMRVWQDMSYQEIAEITGKSEAAAKMAFSRAIGQLRKEMPVGIFVSLMWLF